MQGIEIVVVGVAVIAVVLAVLAWVMDRERTMRVVVAALQVLPRPMRDETFYEGLVPTRAEIGAATAVVAAVGVILMAPLVIGELSAGQASAVAQRVFISAVGALVVWALLAAAGFWASRIAFGRHARWGKLAVGLGFACAPLVLAGLWGVPFGFWIVLVALTWTFALAYFAVRGAMPADPVQTMGVTVAVLLAGVMFMLLGQITCVFCIGFNAFDCPATHPIKAWNDPVGNRKLYALPSDPFYAAMNAEHCLSSVPTSQQGVYLPASRYLDASGRPLPTVTP